MDRCRCPDYEAAVKNLKFYTPGTYRPDLIEKYDRTGFTVSWITIGISHFDNKFRKPKARKTLEWHEIPGNHLSRKAQLIEQMWCPFMSPHVPKMPEEDEPKVQNQELTK